MTVSSSTASSSTGSPASNPWQSSERHREPAVMGQPIIDPAGWHPDSFRDSSCWIYRLNDREIGEIMDAVSAAERDGLDLMAITRDNFTLPGLSASLAEIRAELLDGRGFALIRGLPAREMSREKTARAFWGIGTHMGRALSQNRSGHLLGHVTDLGGDYAKVRGYMTKAEMKFHCDRADFLSLCCLHPAKSGGAHRICSSVTVYNEMLKTRPDLVEELTFRFYRARNGELPPGATEPWTRQPLFSITEGYFAARGASAAIAKGQKLPGVPPLTSAQQEAIALYRSLCEQLYIDIDFEPGDISYVNNHVTLHSRTAFEDWPEPERKRHLLRLWITTDGARPVHEDIWSEIQGVVVEGTTFKASLEMA